MNKEKLLNLCILLLLSSLLQSCIIDGTKDNLGNEYYLYRITGNSDIVGKGDIVLVRGFKKYDMNDSFIIAYRNLNQMFYLVDTTDGKWWRKNNNDSIQFWIINKAIDSSYGPLNKAEYLGLKKELKVPNSLKLDLEGQ